MNRRELIKSAIAAPFAAVFAARAFAAEIQKPSGAIYKGYMRFDGGDHGYSEHAVYLTEEQYLNVLRAMRAPRR